ncbi:winged helix-turn-helix transcriptional regulator [Chitinophaga nivalis]|uniref:Helix-turn-helix transcriptional regulator n=1 Tax=Chitinophaga nivalis TaxID=2991709 RepID=A0ABT3IKD9_9BACT|nr:helix-turn-helix domain-containing protein [Chitinophaga nivalis]MCW3465891.1 helix-turn-helix transcriptional regulator [Chitinophaga nivalis]MCW3484418.1 helix-turn-helix transcriptional regulator [Chitinophaga nivalis]
MYERKIPKPLDCGVGIMMEIIGGKWKPCLIFNIHNGIRRPGELQKMNPAASRRVLTQQLNELEEHGVVRRVVYATVPPKVEYYLTDFGNTLVPVIVNMERWGLQHMDKVLDLMAAKKESRVVDKQPY